MRIAGRVERHLRREQPRRRWKKTTCSSLPRLDWTDGEVEKVEKTTARLLTDWATRFHGGGCPRGATTPARTAMAAVGRSCDFALTTAQSDRRWGGEGRGDHGEATGGRGNVFSWWRARTVAAMLGRQWRAAAVNTALRAGKARGRNGAASAFSRRWPSSGARTRDVVASAEHARHVAILSWAGRPWRH